MDSSVQATVLDDASAAGLALDERPSDAAGRQSAGTRGGESPRRVLVIAGRFPPVASVGAIRIRKFTKYLPAQGWHPTVITGAIAPEQGDSDAVRDAVDPETLKDVPPEAEVHRLARWIDDWPTHLSRTVVSALSGSLGLDSKRWGSAAEWRLCRLRDRLALPDREIWRLPAVTRLALRLHRRFRFDAIFSSGMPFSDHVIALVVHCLIRRPWIADFRDPWVEYRHWKQWSSRGGRRVAERMESSVVRHAARVVSVNDHMTDRFRQRYRGVAASRFVTIQNGFDPDDFPVATESGARFRVLYAGSLYGARQPGTIIDGFRKFLGRIPGARTHAQLDFAGRLGPHAKMVTDAADDETIRYLGFLPHGRAVREMTRADVNVVVLPKIPGGDHDTTTKIYECLGSKRAILAAVPPDGAAARVLGAFDGVWMCDPDDPESVAGSLIELYGKWLAGTLTIRRSSEELASLTREHQTRLLAQCLNEVVPAGRREWRGPA